MPSFRLNTDEFATAYSFVYSLQDQEKKLFHHATQQTLSISGIKAVWYRKLWELTTPTDLDPDYLTIFKQEYQTALQILFQSLNHLPWINQIQNSATINGNKLLQLEMASAFGLLVPRTILTNSPAEVKQFFKANEGNLIMKLHGSLKKSMDGRASFFPTSLLTEEDLNELDSIQYCPMIFQQAIEKQYELRVVFIDGEFFTGKIIAPSDQNHGSSDWRTSSATDAQWERYKLPEEVKSKLTNLMQKMNLSFGAIDIIRQPDGQYVFLEVNPEGEWGMLQRDLNYPIGETIAETLLQKIKNG